MMNWLLLVLLAFPQVQEQAPLTVNTIVEAFKQGVSAQTLIKVIDSATAVTAPTEQDLQTLQQSNVPPEVIQKFKDKAVQLTQAASKADQSAQPEDARLKDIVNLVKAGLSEELIVQQILYSGQVYKMSVGDLIYLKDNKIPESIIGALIRTNNVGTAKKEEPSKEAKAKIEGRTFQPLIYMTGALKKNASGALTIKEGRLNWLDSKHPENNYSLQIASIKTAWLNCSPRPQGNFCSEIGLADFNDHKYFFRDSNWKAGENSQILALFSTLKENFPQIIVQENVK